MHLYHNNINDAFVGIVKGFKIGFFASERSVLASTDQHITLRPPIARSPSRNGGVITIEEPVTVTYSNPLRRVLFNRARDCNPFFHVVEALWMLAGRNDLAPLVHFNSEMAKFSDDGHTLHGAYGERWRKWFKDACNPRTLTEFNDSTYRNETSTYNPEIDQLELCIKALANPNNRRVVLGMWDAEVDLPLIVNKPDCKDVPCNLCVMFRPRLGSGEPSTLGSNIETGCKYVLDMTVINRSNDMMLGALGANYVHFSFLQEYMALANGMEVGQYHQISNNYHQYVDEEGNWLPTKCQPQQLLDQAVTDSHMQYTRGYEQERIVLYNDREQFDEEIMWFFANKMWRAESIQDFGDSAQEWRSPFILQVAIPMVLAFNAHKRRDYLGANLHCKAIRAPDWYIASINWLERREIIHQKAKNGGVHAVDPIRP